MNHKDERARFLEDTDAESRLNNNIQVFKNDLEKGIQTVKNDLEKDIDEIKATLIRIDERLRNIENSTAESRGRNIAFSSLFSFLKDWIIAICAIAALVVSIIALVKG